MSVDAVTDSFVLTALQHWYGHSDGVGVGGAWQRTQQQQTQQ